MPSIFDTLNSVLGENAIGQISQQLGSDPATTGSAVSSALPVLISALAKNSSTPAGVDALQAALQQHDGSVLDDLASHFGAGGAALDNGAAILGKVLGGRQTAVQQTLGQTSGLGSEATGQLLAMLAPVVLGALGRHSREQSLDGSGLAAALGSAQSQATASNAPLGSLVTQLLDSNHDGSVLDDVAKLAGGWLSGGTKS
jgi:hypothetical protein